MKVSTLLSVTTDRIATVSDTSALDASVLIANIIGKPRTWVAAHPELILTGEQQEKLETSLTRLENGEPLPYVLGHWEFFGMDFDVTPDVLIPRPETELLVEKAITWLQSSKSPRHMVADVGTGSGIIAVTIAANIPAAHILATDISQQALSVANHNAQKFKVADRINFMQCDILPADFPTGEHLNLLCANLPYIPTETLHNLPVYGREPTLALDGGLDGLDIFRKLMKIAPKWMAPDSLILLEIEATLGIQALSLAYDMFSSAKIRLHKDLTGRDRLLEVRL